MGHLNYLTLIFHLKLNRKSCSTLHTVSSNLRICHSGNCKSIFLLSFFPHPRLLGLYIYIKNIYIYFFFFVLLIRNFIASFLLAKAEIKFFDLSVKRLLKIPLFKYDLKVVNL